MHGKLSITIVSLTSRHGLKVTGFGASYASSKNWRNCNVFATPSTVFIAQELSKDNSVTSAIHSVLHLDIRPKTNFIIQPDNSRRRKGDP
ncbi:hypothetical protein P5673_021703 [Acropora cervicornis]|uniref:Uncharacterized protein n=1 Tax=Acropora cervicornis TaxID=6130 RepID=A0AAD9Q7E6_ACRCE|nr:hypothetical protein P5673_021703 [Acropora cervicornis]